MEQPIERLPSVVGVASGRFTLRRYAAADAEPLGRAINASIEHLRTFMPWAAHEPLPIPARLELFAQWDREWQAGESAVYGMFAGDDIVGGAGLHRRRAGRPDVVEIGYWVHVDHDRRRVAGEAAAALTDAAFQLAATTAVEIMHLPDNVASRGVPAKLGYRDLGEACVREQTFAVWQVTRADWSAGGAQTVGSSTRS